MNTAVLEKEDIGIAEQSAGLLTAPEQPSGETSPGWRREIQSTGWKKFESLPLPSRGDEAWRFASLKSHDLSRYTVPQPVDPQLAEELISRSEELGEIAGKLVFANDQLLVSAMLDSSLAEHGVIWLPIEQAAQQHPQLFAKHFMREEAALGSQKFAALHQAWVRNGTFLYVPPNVEVKLPLETYHWLAGNHGSCFPHTLIVAGANAKVTLVDYFASADSSAPGFACGVNDLWLGEGAKVTYVNVQRWSRAAVSVQVNSTVVGRNASANALTANFGGGSVRSESISHLRGDGGRSDMLSFSVADGEREIDQRTLQIHETPHTASDLLYKNSLEDKSRTIFAGLIRVAPGAHFTDAYQKVRNLILSDDAEANSAPGLEIEADNVRCTHGATSGQIEGEELFYLLSRGIPKQTAQKLISFGFLNEVIERVPEMVIQEKLRDILRSCAGN